MIIYRVINITNQKVYIGMTCKKLCERKAHHLHCSITSNRYFHNALKKYKKENFVWQILDKANNYEELKEKEKLWIELHFSNNKLFGYNLTDGGDGCKNLKHSDKTKEKLRNLNLGKKLTENTKIKLRNHFKGKGSITYDHKIYNFYHFEIGNEFCTQYELRKKYNLPQSSLSLLTRNKANKCRGWKVI
jgi:group I intron endonuclease